MAALLLGAISTFGDRNSTGPVGRGVSVAGILGFGYLGMTGPYYIDGYVDKLGGVGPYLVSLFDKATKTVIQERWSDALGYYRFENLAYKPQGYFTVAFDHESLNRQNADIADLITPALMT